MRVARPLRALLPLPLPQIAAPPPPPLGLQRGALRSERWCGPELGTQIDAAAAAAAARLMKICSELCGDARCRDVSRR